MFIRYPHGKATVPLRHFVPNLITTISLCCGLASIHFTLNLDWHGAILAIILAAVFDALDGRAARLLKVTSSFGAVLDSLADFLSFGVAPAVLLYQWMLRYEDAFGLAAVMTFALCSALRLARFTAAVKPAGLGAGAGGSGGAGQKSEITTEEDRRLACEEARATRIAGTFFVGMPTPAAAAAVLIPPMLMFSRTIGQGVREFFGIPMASPATDTPLTVAQVIAATKGQVADPATPAAAWTVIVYTFLIAFLMVSRIPMFSFKKLRVSKHAFVPLLLIAGLLVALVVRDRWLAISVVAGAYLASLVLSTIAYRRLMALPIETFLAEPPARRAKRA
jgi:CDP-diacylglycerol--serine O-phosphatidyltransferase